MLRLILPKRLIQTRLAQSSMKLEKACFIHTMTAHKQSWALLRVPSSSSCRRMFNSQEGAAATSPPPRVTPKLQITFTCKACDHRSTHEMSKQAYTEGTVLIQCPSCKNRHMIADNLKIFSDVNTNIEDVLRAKGETIQRGRIRDGDIEIIETDANKVLQ